MPRSELLYSGWHPLAQSRYIELGRVTLARGEHGPKQGEWNDSCSVDGQRGDDNKTR